MANIKSIGGNPIVPASVEDGSITKAKLATDLARDRERLLYRLANMLTNTLPEGDVATASDAAKTPVAGLALYGRSTQAGTPTPSAPVPIESVEPDSDGNISLLARGFNQWDEVAEDGYISDTTGENAGYNINYLRSKGYIHVFPNTEYHFTCTNGRPAGKVYYYDADKAYLSFNEVTFGGNNKTTPANARYMRFWLNYPGSYNNDICINISDPSRNGTYQPYESTVTPIPLDGHELRSLPDGTRDEVTVGADGHAVLVQRVQLTTQAVTDGVTGTVGVDVMSSTGAIANGATVLYKLATPVTIDLGYVAAVPLVGPDLTAQAVPTAPFALTYERDLNTTLARLESAIATLV